MTNLINKGERREGHSDYEIEMQIKALGDMEMMSAPERGNFIKIYSKK